MSDFSRILSPLANLTISKALYGQEKDQSTEKNNELNRIVRAKNSFMGRITNQIISSQPLKISQAIRQMFYASIGHFLKPGILAKIIDNSIFQPRNDKPLPARSANIQAESLGSWHELETLQSTLAQLKTELNSTHEKNQQNFKISMADISDMKSLAALKEGYPKEAELKSKVAEQEKKVADFEKRLSAQKHVPAFPIRPRPPARPELAQAIIQQKAVRKNYHVPTNVDGGLSAREKARMLGSPTRSLGPEQISREGSLNNAGNINSATRTTEAANPLEASSSPSKAASKIINTNFDPARYAAQANNPNPFLKQK